MSNMTQDPFAGLAAPDAPEQEAPRPQEPEPTDRQVKFYRDLLARKAGEDEATQDARIQRKKDSGNWTKRRISKAIDALLAMPDKPREEVKAAGGSQVEPPEGFHLLDDNIYSVKVAVHGSGKLIGRRLCTENAEAVKAAWKEWDEGGRHGKQPKLDWEYVGRRGVFWNLSEDTLMTMEQMQAMGHLYGICCSCGATLTKQESIDRGMGPVCARKF